MRGVYSTPPRPTRRNARFGAYRPVLGHDLFSKVFEIRGLKASGSRSDLEPPACRRPFNFLGQGTRGMGFLVQGLEDGQKRMEAETLFFLSPTFTPFPLLLSPSHPSGHTFGPLLSFGESWKDSHARRGRRIIVVVIVVVVVVVKSRNDLIVVVVVLNRPPRRRRGRCRR